MIFSAVTAKLRVKIPLYDILWRWKTQDEILFRLLFNLGLISKNPLPGTLLTLDILNEWAINRNEVFKNRELFFNGDAFAAFAVVVAKARYHKHENVLPLIL